jgi:hypothetical protein
MQQTAFNPALAEHWLIVVAEFGYPLSAVEYQVVIDARRRIGEDAVADSVAEDGAPAVDGAVAFAEGGRRRGSD